MARSYLQVVLHVTFGTKYREPWIDPDIEPHLHGYLAALLTKRKCFVHRIGGTFDHVHLVFSIPATQRICDVLKEVKAVSSRWMNTEWTGYERFAWQSTYAAHSVDYFRKARAVGYLKKQKRHHFGFELDTKEALLKYFGIMWAKGYNGPWRPAELAGKMIKPPKITLPLSAAPPRTRNVQKRIHQNHAFVWPRS